MSNSNSKGPVSVSTSAELRAALVAGYTADEIVMPDSSAQLATARNEGVTAGRAESASAIASARAEGVIEGRTQECARIKAVESAVLPGHEALISSLKFDGKTSGPEAAAQVITAERTSRGQRLDDLNNDAQGARVNPSVAPTIDPPSAAAKPKVDPSLPVEDRCKAEWQHDPGLRAEFGNDVDSYISYTKANESGRVKALRHRTDK